jgi:hypothetical protein
MEIGKSKGTPTTRVGEILVRSQVITQAQLDEALILAKRTATPVGRILLMTGGLREAELECALQAQYMMRARQISYDLGIRSVYIAKNSRVPYQEALRIAGYGHEPENELGELEQLLIAAEVLSETQINSARARSRDMDLSLGRALVLTGLISPSVMAAALNALVLMKNCEINKQEAIYGIKIATARRISLEQALILEGIYCPKTDAWIKLGELFAIAGLLSESDGLWAVETGLNQGRPLGEILIESGLVSPESCEAALTFQRLVGEGQVRPKQAAELLKGVNRYGLTPEGAIKQLNYFGVQVVTLLKLAGLVSEEDLMQSDELQSRQSVDQSASLYESGLIDGRTLEAARDCLRLVRADKLNVEQAVIVLIYCVRLRTTVRETLEELAWDQVRADQISSETDLAPQGS